MSINCEIYVYNKWYLCLTAAAESAEDAKEQAKKLLKSGVNIADHAAYFIYVPYRDKQKCQEISYYLFDKQCFVIIFDCQWFSFFFAVDQNQSRQWETKF